MKLIINYRRSFTLLICGALSFIASANNDAIAKFKANKSFRHASIGFCVKDISTGKNIANYNTTQSLTPASILKVVTTASALEVLGADYQFETTLGIDKSDDSKIIITGYGDPTLGSEFASNAAENFEQTCIQQIKANVKKDKISILVDDSYFGYDGLSRKWIREDMGNYFAAGAYGISIFDNTYRLFFNTTGSKATITKTGPLMRDLSFVNELSLNTANKDNGYVLGEPFSNQRTVIGDIPAGRTAFSIKGDIPDPGLFLGEYLSNNLKKNGFSVETFTTIRIQPQIVNQSVFYTHKSPILSNIIRTINVRSNNHYTEHLIRAIGRNKNPDIKSNPLTEGIENINDFWKSKGFDTEGLFMYDGCGLSPSNAVNPALMCDILTYMQTRSKYSSAFFQSLPQAGKEGTVRNFLKGTRLEGKVYVKSGSIAKTQCFAGYYIDGSKKYAFTIMINNFNGSHRDTVKAIEQLFLSIF